LAPVTVTTYPVGVEKGEVVLDMRRTERWELGELTTWGPGILRITAPGAGFDVWAFWHGDRRLSHWYVNVGEPFRRTPTGFDTMDQILDVIVEPDLSCWRWKDDWELDLAVEMGVRTLAEAGAIRETALEVIRGVEAGNPPWSTSWPIGIRQRWGSGDGRASKTVPTASAKPGSSGETSTSSAASAVRLSGEPGPCAPPKGPGCSRSSPATCSRRRPPRRRAWSRRRRAPRPVRRAGWL